MQIIIVPPKRRTSLIKEKILILLLIIASLGIIFIALMEMQRPRPSHVLENSIQGMSHYDGMLGVQIIEEGNGYNLNFNGRILEDKTVSGEIGEYDLEVYVDENGELFIKDLLDGNWKNAAVLELEALKEFINIPFGLLEQHHNIFDEARFVQENEDEHVIKLFLPPDPFSPSQVSQESRMECLLFIEKDMLFIRQISFYLYENGDNEEKLRRIFFFSEMHGQEEYERDKKDNRIAAASRQYVQLE